MTNFKNHAALIGVAAVAFFASSPAVASADAGGYSGSYSTPVASCSPGVDCHFSATTPPMSPEDYQVYSTIGLMPGSAYPADEFANSPISTSDLQSLGFVKMGLVGGTSDEPQVWWVGPLDEQGNGGVWQALDGQTNSGGGGWQASDGQSNGGAWQALGGLSNSSVWQVLQ